MTNEEMHRAMEFIIQQQAQYAARIDKDEAQYAARFEKEESRLARLEESFKMLVKLARRAQERADRVSETRATLSHTMNELEQRTITDDSRLASLEESFKVLVELARKHGAFGCPEPNHGDNRGSNNDEEIPSRDHHAES